MKKTKTFIKDLFIIEPQVFKDDRGYFMESFKDNWFKNEFPNINFVQDNESKSTKGVVRGFHFQKPPHAQTKIIRCVSGKILNVVVDLRKTSKTYGQSFSIELSSISNKQLFVPKGFAHGFQVISDEAIVNYKVDNFYNAKSDSGIIWNDKDLSINWSIDVKPILSVKDLKLISFKELKSPF